MKLYQRDIQFLLRYISDVNLREKLENFQSNDITNRSFSVLFSDEELDILEDELSRLLLEMGFSDNGEINAQGIYIERFIDLVRDQYFE